MFILIIMTIISALNLKKTLVCVFCFLNNQEAFDVAAIQINMYLL